MVASLGGSRLLAVGRIGALAENLKQLIAPRTCADVRIDTSCYKHLIDDNWDFHAYQSILVNVENVDAVMESLDVVATLRANNMTSKIFVIITGSGNYKKVKYYLAGADHCIKVSASSNKELAEFSELINRSPCAHATQLLLDPTCMCILGEKEKLDISFIDMKVLEVFAQSGNLILSHDEIARIMGLNVNFYDPRALEKSISRLRGKIKAHFGVNAIHSVRGYGYRLTRGLILST